MLTLEEESKPVYKHWGFWAVLAVCLLLLSLAGGALANSGHFSDDHLADPDASIHAEQGHRSAARSTWERTQHLSKVRRFLKKGVIARIHEPSRSLYVNDPVWNVFSDDQKEQTVRVVAEYLDWVHEAETGMLDVRSHRTGRRLMMIQ